MKLEVEEDEFLLCFELEEEGDLLSCVDFDLVFSEPLLDCELNSLNLCLN